MLSSAGVDVDRIAPEVDGKVRERIRPGGEAVSWKQRLLWSDMLQFDDRQEPCECDWEPRYSISHATGSDCSSEFEKFFSPTVRSQVGLVPSWASDPSVGAR
jgi:hypothetical protein